MGIRKIVPNLSRQGRRMCRIEFSPVMSVLGVDLGSAWVGFGCLILSRTFRKE